MKLALLEATVTKISGTEFEDGQQVIRIALEDGYSFNVPATSQLVNKISEGFELDLTYNVAKPNKTEPTTSGAQFTFHNLTGVKILAVRAGVLDEVIASLPDVPTRNIAFKKVGSGSTGGTNNPPPKV